MDSKTVCCAAVAAVSLGVTIGLAASSTTSLHVPSTAQTAMASRTMGVATPANSYVNAPRTASTVMQAAQEDAEVMSHAAPSSTNWMLGAVISASAAVGAAVFATRQRATSTYESIRDDPEAALGNAGRALGAVAVSAALAGSANAASLTFDDIQSLSYMEVKGSGLANQCPLINDGTGDKLNLKAGNYKIDNMCIEPSSFQVKVPQTEGGKPTEFEKTKLMTRLTYTLAGITADLQVGGGGEWRLQEKDGIDYAATTVQLAGGERVPFLFTVKNLDAKGDAGQLIGQFDVPSYRGGTFLDPKGRGGATGYDTAVALPASGDDPQYAKENLKNVAGGVGTIAFKVAKVNANTGEIAGVFESIQPSDTDLGAKVAKDIKASGVWYAQISPA